MAFGVGGFNPPSKSNFANNFSKGLGDDADFKKVPEWTLDTNPFKFTPKDNSLRSRIRFYDHDSLWSRWRRGYELYTLTQTNLGSSSNERSVRGDYRVYCAFQQFPGIFTSARLFSFPTINQEVGQQIVGMRDANGFSFYDFGLPILAVRYLGDVTTTTYSQSGTTITVSKADHGLRVGESIYLDFVSGAAVDETLSIVSITQNTFTLTASAPATTSGTVDYYLTTTFTDTRWTTMRAKVRYIPSPATFLVGERIADRIVEKDPGISATYSRVGDTVTVSCASAHGLSTGNTVYLGVATGLVDSGRYVITVLNSTDFEVTTIGSGATSGNLTVSRLLIGYRYDNYVGYTVVEVDVTTNEIVCQRDDSYGCLTVNTTQKTVVPAQRGFEVGRFLTTELRWQCSCQDFTRRDGYNFYSNLFTRRFPVTAITSTKPGQVQDKDANLSNERDIPGSFGDLGYVTLNNFYELPTYKDTKQTSYPNLQYYQLRWCKHIYAAMFSLLHDEGNTPLSLACKYIQSGPNITVDAPNHGLAVNSQIQIDFTSGNAVSGPYTITSVPNKDQFVVVYPFSETTSGYCTVSNVKEHEYVGAWLLEPNDKPIGDDLDAFYRNFEKENEGLRQVIDRIAMLKQGTKWVGNKTITGERNLPQQIANYDPQLITMLLTDSIKRANTGNLDRDGTLTNQTNRMISLISKLFNVDPRLLQDVKFGLLEQPLVNYTGNFEFGLVTGGTYRNGLPIEDQANTSTLDCGTYSPVTAQDTVVNSGLYVNT